MNSICMYPNHHAILPYFLHFVIHQFMMEFLINVYQIVQLYKVKVVSPTIIVIFALTHFSLLNYINCINLMVWCFSHSCV